MAVLVGTAPGCTSATDSAAEDAAAAPLDTIEVETRDGEPDVASTPLATLDAAGCVALCTETSSDAVDGACRDFDGCLDFCASVLGTAENVAGGRQPCDSTVERFEECVVALAERRCDGGVDLASLPECTPLFLDCLANSDDTPLALADRATTVLMCAILNQQRGSSIPSVDDCVLWLARDACSCLAGEGPRCDLTVGDFRDCVDSAAFGGDLDHPSCAALRAGAEIVEPSGDRSLYSLGCGEVRAACEGLVPNERPSIDEYTVCRDAPGIVADYNSPAETCTAAVGALKCHCAANPDGEGCDANVRDLAACMEGAMIDGCPYLGDGSCIAPHIGPSGIATDDAVGILAARAPETLAQWCDWRACLSGGPGYVPALCSPSAHAVVPDTDACVEDLSAVFAECDTTLQELESCALYMLQNDACHRLATFGSCVFTKEFFPCHLPRTEACASVNRCFQDVWDITDFGF